jgi:hypothetical protein
MAVLLNLSSVSRQGGWEAGWWRRSPGRERAAGQGRRPEPLPNRGNWG